MAQTSKMRIPGRKSNRQRAQKKRELEPLQTFKQAYGSGGGQQGYRSAGSGQQANGGGGFGQTPPGGTAFKTDTEDEAAQAEGQAEGSGGGEATSATGGRLLNEEAQQYADTGATSGGGEDDVSGTAPTVDEADAFPEELPDEPGPVGEAEGEIGFAGEEEEEADGGGLGGDGDGVTADGEPDPLDEQYEKLLAEHDEGFDAIQDQIMNQSAIEKRRFLEQAAREGYSVGGYTGAGQANLAMQTIQTLADSRAQHEREKRSLQLAWMEKKLDQNFTREIENKGLARQMLMSIMASGEPLDPETMKFFADMAGMDLSEFDWDAGDGGTSDGFTPSESDSDTGELPTDPENPEGRSFGSYEGTDYYSEGSTQTGGVKHYSYDAEGNKVYFEPGVGENGEYPGDPRLSTTGDYSYDAVTVETEMVERSWATDYQDQRYVSPQGSSSIMDTEFQKLVLDAMPHVYGDQWPEGTMVYDEGGIEQPEFNVGNATPSQQRQFEAIAGHHLNAIDDPSDHRAGGPRAEAMSFVLKYMDENDGAHPSPEDLAEHLKNSGVI